LNNRHEAKTERAKETTSSKTTIIPLPQPYRTEPYRLPSLAPKRLEALAVDGKVVRNTRPDDEHDNKFSALSH